MANTNKALIYIITAALILLNSCDKQNNNLHLLSSTFFTLIIDGKQTILYTLKNEKGSCAQFTNYGARWLSMWVPDKRGNFKDVVLGFEKLDGYRNATEKYHGATVGRICGRIDRGVFYMDGDTFKLANNDGFGEPVRNNLHGGVKGFHAVVWNGKMGKNSYNEEYVEFTYFSKDGEEGFPGDLNAKVTYTLTSDNSIKIEYEATSNKPTVVNLTNHAFFNLSGNPKNNILSHRLTLKADSFVECNQYLIPTGKILGVEGTPLDFRKPINVGKNIDSDYDQVFKGKGFAVAYVNNLDSSKPLTSVAMLEDTLSGITMEVKTDQPSLQFYNGWLFNGKDIGKGNIHYNESAGLVLETQQYPDAPNHNNFPSIRLEPGKVYHHTAIYKFGISL